MFTRSLAILLAPWLPLAALIFPMGTAHRINDLVAGTLATVLSGVALGSDRARIAAAVIGGWVALTAFIFPSTLLEEVVALSWGTLMVSWLAGPFSAAPKVFKEAAAAPEQAVADTGHQPLAA
jgi:hypothetical protein